MKVKIDDNGEQKRDSIDASIYYYIDGGNSMHGVDVSFNLWGYGKNKEQAMANLQKSVDLIKTKLAEINWELKQVEDES